MVCSLCGLRQQLPILFIFLCAGQQRPILIRVFCFSAILGLNGQSNRRVISLDEVKQHQTGGAMWTVLKGRVYNIAPYMKFHPGGTDTNLVCLYFK